jgi:hypothetical protein
VSVTSIRTVVASQVTASWKSRPGSRPCRTAFAASSATIYVSVVRVAAVGDAPLLEPLPGKTPGEPPRRARMNPSSIACRMEYVWKGR